MRKINFNAQETQPLVNKNINFNVKWNQRGWKFKSKQAPQQQDLVKWVEELAYTKKKFCANKKKKSES